MYDYNQKNYDCPGQTMTRKGPQMPGKSQGKTTFGMPPQPQRQPETQPATRQEPEVIQPMEETPQTPKDKALARFDVVASSLAKVKGYQALTVDLRDKETFKKVNKRRLEVRGLRLKIQNRQKEKDADLVFKRKTLKTDALILITELKVTETHLIKEEEKWNAEEDRLKEIAAENERARVQTISNNLEILTQVCNKGLWPGQTSEAIQTALTELQGTLVPQEVFQEKYQDACNLLNVSIESVQRNLDGALDYEKKQEQAAQLKKEGQRVDQVTWFNENFGVMSSVEVMEAGIEHLENGLKFLDAESYNNIADLISNQLVQGKAILDKTKAMTPPAVEPEPDPVEESPPPEINAPRGTTKEMDEAREIPGIKSASVEPDTVQYPATVKKEETPKILAFTAAKEETPDIDQFAKMRLVESFQAINAVIQATSPGKLELIVSNGQVMAPIKLPPAILHEIMDGIRTHFITAINTAKA